MTLPAVRPRPLKLACLVTHPIQYQAPLLRAVAAEPDIELTVFFQSDVSLKPFVDAGFGVEIAWDTPLLEGYRSVFLPADGPTDRIDFWRPRSRGLWRCLRQEKFDALWVHGYARAYHLQAMVMGRLLGAPVLVRDDATLVSKPRSALNHLFKFVLITVLRGLCRGFLTTGALNAAYFRRYGVTEAEIFPMVYAVDNDFFRRGAEEASLRRGALRAELGLDDGVPVILYAAKMEPRKRADHLLAAYAALCREISPAPYLVLAGDGEMRPLLEQQAAGLDRVRFIGFQGQRQLPALFDLADVFVLPSIHEPWGLAINEAMSAGTAIIVSDEVGCALDLVEDGVTGFVVKAGDIPALTAALRRIVTDPAAAAAMAAAGRARIDGWSISRSVQGLRCALGLKADPPPRSFPGRTENLNGVSGV